MPQRKILVVGCGAVGGLVAALLSAVADVTAYDVSPQQVGAVRAHGLRVSGLLERTVRIAIHDDPAALAGTMFDAVIFLIKSSATGAAIAKLRPVLAGRPILVTLQNGMGNDEVLLRATDLPVARGAMAEAARMVAPGHAEYLIRGQTALGPRRGPVAELRWLAEIFNAAGLKAELLDDPMPAVWSKFVFNSVMNPVGALLLGVNAARFEVSEVVALMEDMAEEARRVVAALGGTLASDPLAYVRKVRAGEAPLSSHAGSMALDIARGAPTEIDEMTGYLVREGERLGIPVPTCKTVYRLIKGLELAAARRASLVEDCPDNEQAAWRRPGKEERS